MSGPWSTFIAAYLGMLMILPIALAYSMLIPYIPETGGEYKWTYRTFGGLHGFIAGWWLYISYVSIVLLNATAFPVWLRILAPQLVRWDTCTSYKVYLGYIVASLLILTVFFLVNYFGVRTTGKTQNLMSLILYVYRSMVW